MNPRSDQVIVIAGGPSVTREILDALPAEPIVIGVNDSAILAPRVDIAVSMDRLWTEGRLATLIERKLPAFIRRSALQNIPQPWPDSIHAFDCDHESSVLSDNLHTLNGTNSGACGLNLAYVGKPRRIFLYGFDMDHGGHWHEPYPWKGGGGTGKKRLGEWASQFDVAAAQCRDQNVEVFNVSPGSAIRSFVKISPVMALQVMTA